MAFFEPSMHHFEASSGMLSLNSPLPFHQNVPPEDWQEGIRAYLDAAALPVHFVGVGNPLRRDDGVGMFVASELRARITGAMRHRAVVHGGSGSPESLLSRLPPDEGLVIFDAVEAGLGAGSIICAALRDTRYSFFATHNIPLKVIPGVAERKESACVIGIEPESLEVGEGLTPRVKASAKALTAELVEQLVGPHG